MELNEEVVKKSLDWLDSLVGNSNDSDIALLTYQLLGILYDTCEELTEENERLREDNEIKSQKRANIFEIVNAFERGRTDGVRKMQERFKANLHNTAMEVFGHNRYYLIGEQFIDQIAKETLEGEK